MAQENPFTLTFGKAPRQIIPRTQEAAIVLDSFRAANPSQQVFMITGPRGCGKTVFLTDIANVLSQDARWIVADLNPERDLLVGLAAKLSSQEGLARVFREAKIDLSFFGLGVSASDATPITDIEVALSRMLESLEARDRRVLIAIDEVASTQHVRAFASAFQSLLRQDLPVYLLMTGLYDNINRLQNERSLTFLYRAPKVELKPLGIRTMASSYQRIFDSEAADALRMARRTRGYSFAFQVLGYLTWEQHGFSDEVYDEYRQLLADLSYDKIWSELSPKDRHLAWGIAQSKSGRVAEVRSILGMQTNEFNPYRRRLVRKGIIDGSERGYVRFLLPCFEDYVIERYGEVELD